MKYNWETMNDDSTYQAFKHEAELETHNGTTKQDLVNIIKWLWNRFDYTVECEGEWE